MSLRRRLIFLILLILPLSLLFGGVLTYWHALEKVETEMAAAIALGETTVRDTVKTWPEGQTAGEQAKRLIQVFDGERHLRASLIGSDGAQIVSSRPAPPVLPAPEWLQQALAGPCTASTSRCLRAPARCA